MTPSLLDLIRDWVFSNPSLGSWTEGEHGPVHNPKGRQEIFFDVYDTYVNYYGGGNDITRLDAADPDFLPKLGEIVEEAIDRGLQVRLWPAGTQVVNSYLGAGYVYAPYIPLMETPDLRDLIKDYKITKKSIITRYKNDKDGRIVKE